MNEWVEVYPKWGINKIYVCPRGITVHRGWPAACGRQCHNARDGGEYQYDEEPVVKLFVVHKEVRFNGDMLRRAKHEGNQEPEEGAHHTSLLRYASVSGA